MHFIINCHNASAFIISDQIKKDECSKKTTNEQTGFIFPWQTNSITKVLALAMHSVYSNFYFHSSVTIVTTETVPDDISCVATITCGAMVTVSRDGCNKKISIFTMILRVFIPKRNYL